MQIKTYQQQLPKIDNSVFPYSFDEFLDAISVCELFLFNDRSINIITKTVRTHTDQYLAGDFLKRVYQKFTSDTISMIKDEKFQTSFRIIVEYYLKTQLFGKISFKGDEKNHYISQSDNMWKMFNEASNKIRTLNNHHHSRDEEFIKIYKRFRENENKLKYPQQSLFKHVEHVEPKKEVVQEKEQEETNIESWMKNFDSTKIPKPITPFIGASWQPVTNPRMEKIIRMVRSGKYKNGIEIEKALEEEEKQKELEKLKANLEVINKTEETKKAKEFEESETTQKYAESMDKLSNKLGELQSFLNSHEKTQNELAELKKKFEILESSIQVIERQPNIWQKIVSWFR